MVKDRKKLLVDTLKDLGGEANISDVFNHINDNDRFGMSKRELQQFIRWTPEIWREGETLRLIE